MKRHLIIIITSLFCIINSVFSQLSDGLVLYYNFNASVEDQSPLGNDGTDIDLLDTTNHIGNSNEAMYFDGDETYVVLPENESVKPNLPITFTVNLKIDDLSEVASIYHSDYIYNKYAGFWINISTTGQIYAHISNANLDHAGVTNRRSFVTNEIVTVGEWHRLTVVINAFDDMEVYIDCERTTGVYSGTGDTEMVYSTYSGRIGQGAGNSAAPDAYNFNGSMDEIGLWNRALGTSEINSICDGMLNLTEENNLQFDIYPNPATNSATLTFIGESLDKIIYFSISDVAGRVVSNGTILPSDNSININGFSKGIYSVNLFNDNKILGSKQLVIL